MTTGARQRFSAPAALLLRPFQTFFALESAASLLLLLCTVAALAWANSPAADSYFHLWERTLTIAVEGVGLTKTLHHWINDGLMAVFFFVIGLEIKREVLVGELSTARKAALPLAAAVGGMAVPALLYLAFNAGTENARGWGIPMATDIAFALGILALVGRGAPIGVKVFLTALAIVDDLGAVLVIAIFYTAELSGVALGAAGLLLIVMLGLNRAGVYHLLPYLVCGIALWVAVLQSGVHATIAGVLSAMTIPARRRIDAAEFLERARQYLGGIEEDLRAGRAELTENQRDALFSLEQRSEELLTPLLRLEHLLHPYVAYLIMPVFAFSNAGVQLGGGALQALTDGVALGIVVGLVAGKQIGVMAFSWIAVRSGLAALPENTSWRQLYGVACLCGIGFTMSLFIAALAFPDPTVLDTAKVGILVASLISGIWGAMLLRRA